MKAFEKIKEARENEGLKQSEIAEELGISQNNVSKLESGNAKFIPNSYIEFLQRRNYDINSLFDDNLPLQKRDIYKEILSEPTSRYSLNTVDNTQNHIFEYLQKSLGVSSNSHLIELFTRFDEKGNHSINLHEMLTLHYWEKSYLSRINQMERDIIELKSQLSEIKKNKTV